MPGVKEGARAQGTKNMEACMTRKTTAIALSVMLAAILLFMGSGFGYADPVQDKKNELERIKSEVQRIDAQLETVTEQYNLTNIRVAQARERIAEKESQLASLNAELEQRKDILGSRLREIYKAGNADILEVITECKTVDDLYTNLDRAQRIGGGDVDIITSVLASREEIEAAKAGLQAEKAELDAAVAQLGAQKSQIEGELQRRQSLMSGVESEVNALIALDAGRLAASWAMSELTSASTPLMRLCRRDSSPSIWLLCAPSWARAASSSAFWA